ncbi:P-loop containing nucleoside triphosphate hydrolase protein [Dentipellis sp. KUC8613]|nr:P-loop containing nucleoside triphosphate hydrolase protein [Dentipellis sp. KUC8613]
MVLDERLDSPHLNAQMIVIGHDSNRSQTASTLVDGEYSAMAHSDPVSAEERQEALQLMNSLQGTGVRSDIDIPTIAVVGNQSSGKSSMIRAISGVTMPRDPGLCTRVPLECHLLHSENTEWSCKVTLRFFTDSAGNTYSPALNVPFGEPLTEAERHLVEDRIRRAQLSILTPTRPTEEFLVGRLQSLGTGDMRFSTNLVSLEIRGPTVEDLSFVDLPGIIRNVGSNGDSADIKRIEDLVVSYISKPSCIILLVVACETDFANQDGFNLAKEYDPEGKRTVGVLTKVDRIDPGDRDRWLERLRGVVDPLAHGWFSTKQPDATGLQLNTSWQDAQTQEERFFAKEDPWYSLPREHRDRLGTRNLTRKLSRVLSDLIRQRLPDLKNEVNNLLESTRLEINTLPQHVSGDVVWQVVKLIQSFAVEVQRQLSRSGDNDTILQKILSEKRRFRQAIRATAPDFRPWKSDADVKEGLNLVPSFLDEGDDPGSPSASTAVARLSARSQAAAQDRSKAIFADTVHNLAEEHSSRELLSAYPPEVSDFFIRRVTDGWEGPAKEFVDNVVEIIKVTLKKAMETHFRQYTNGRIKKWVSPFVMNYLNGARERTQEFVKLLLRAERIVDSGNNRDFRAYKDKYLTHYKMLQGLAAGDRFTRSLMMRPYNASSTQDASSEFQSGERQFMTATAKMSVKFETKDLPKLLPSSPLDPVVIVMADVSAYFQVSLNRFTDYATKFVDLELVTGLQSDGLSQSILSTLNLSDPETVERCEHFLQEAPDVAEYRRELEMKLERLKVAYTRMQEAEIYTA